MSTNTKVKLKSFLGKQKSGKSVSENENYWFLIGKSGEIIERNNLKFVNRVLVLFDDNLDKMNLINHNPIKNSLWILETDLEFSDTDIK